MSDYRYILEPYQGMKSRFNCPQCGGTKEYTRYLDPQTGKHLPFEYGKCNRENSCDYHLNPYTDGYAKRVGANEIGDSSKPVQAPGKKIPPKPKPILKRVFFPLEVLNKSLTHYENNMFVSYLLRLFGEEQTTALIERFYIGTSKHWQGATVFWLIDELNRIAGGQVILFDEDGHTKKVEYANGRKKRFNSWVHTALKAGYEKQEKPLPDWLQTYIKHSPKFPCLFGLPQLRQESLTKHIAIVEAAKTAVIATGYLPQYIWLSVGSLSYLNADRLQTLKGRNITLFPDKGGYEKWNDKIESFSQFANVTISDLLEKKEVEAGADLADYLTRYNVEEFRKS